MIVAFGVVLLLAILISGIAHRTILSTAVLFLVAGFLLGQGMFGVLHLQEGDEGVSVIAQFALFVVLFTDGQRLSIRDLRSAWRLPGRALLLGMPLTFAISTLLGVALLGLSWPEALLVAAVLAPTDPVFASAIVGREEIPRRVRSLLNVESGLNDGLALPVVLILIASIGGPEVEAGELILELTLGIALGIVVPWLVLQLLRLKIFTTTPLYAALSPVAIGIIVYGVAEITHANLYLAAFSAGITIASTSTRIRDAFAEYGEFFAEIIKLLAIFVFGALVSPALLADVPFIGYIFAILLMVVARPAAVIVSLAGSKMPWEEKLTAAWFGPKGFASVLYGLLVLESGIPDASYLFHVIVVAITVSIVAHSSTDVPIAAYFERQEKRDRAAAGIEAAKGEE